MLALTLARRCPVCAAAVTYSGRGRRPAYCSPSCKRVERAEAARFRRARRSGGGQLYEAEAAIDRLAEERPTGSVLPEAAFRAHAAGEGFADPFEDGYLPDGWAERRVDLPSKDRAAFAATAHYLAEHHPEALADFPAAY